MWKKFKIGDLFEIKGNPQLNKESFNFGENSEYPYFTRTVCNNGILGKVDYLDDEHLIKGNSLAVGMIGMEFFYMNHDFYAGQFTKTAFPKFDGFNETLAAYFITLLNKFQKKFQAVLVRDFEKTFCETLLSLPAKNDDIAFDYMESCIKILEEECLENVETYLQENGLNDTSLTKEEEAALEKFRNGEIVWKEFRIEKLFDIHPTQAYKMTNVDLFKTAGNVPVVTNSSVENGITGWVNLQPTEKGGMITYSDTTTSEGIFYQPYDFVGYSHVQGLYPINPTPWNESTLLYFVSLFRRTAGGRFDYANKFNRNIAKKMPVSLPINIKDGSIDYDFMEHFIKALEKLSLRGVIELLHPASTDTETPIDDNSASPQTMAAESRCEY